MDIIDEIYSVYSAQKKIDYVQLELPKGFVHA